MTVSSASTSGPIKKRYIFMGLVFGSLMVAGLSWLIIEYDLFTWVTQIINEKTPPGLFIGLMLVLPMVGVPFSLFILLLAVKFGVLNGLLILETVLPLQMLTAYLLVIVIRKPIENYLVRRKNFQLPTIPENKEFLFSFLFLALPLFPYAVKIYLLPVAGVKFRYCFWLNWITQGILCIPFVLAGKSAVDIFGAFLGNNGGEIDYTLLGMTIVFFMVIAVFMRWLKQKYSALEKEKLPD